MKRLQKFVQAPQAAYAALFCVMLACHLQFLYIPGDEAGYAAALVWAKRREWLLRAVSLMPCVLMVPLSLYQYELGAVVPWVKQMAAAYTAAGYISLANCNAPAAYVPLLLSYGLYAAVLWSIYAAMGFTPSVGVSGLRTGTLYYFFVIAACMVLYRRLPQKRRAWLWCLLAWFCLVQLHALLEV